MCANRLWRRARVGPGAVWLRGVALAGAAGLAAEASGQMLSGNVSWTDGDMLVHPAREVAMDFFGEAMSPLGPISVYLGSTTTDINGDYTHMFAPPPGLFFVSARASARNGAAYVSSDTTLANTYSIGDGHFGTGGTIDIVGDTASAAGRAFSVADAMYTGWYWAGQARTAGAPARVPVVFPETGAGTASYYDPTDQTIHIRSWRRWAWDVMDHEYGHYLADLDSLDMNPGGSHSFGVSNIPGHGKLDGIRLAWGEGLGTFNGIASHNIDQVLQNMPTTMATVGDTKYTSLNSDTPMSTFEVDIEGMAGSLNAGEGDETSCVRILWDIADPKNEAHDRVERGLVQTYQDLDSIGGLDRLDDVWDFYFTLAGTDKARTDYGAIFEEYQVSPHPHDGPIGEMLNPAGSAPTFEWDRQNGGESDEFGLIVWDDTFSTRLLDIMIPGNVESYTLTAAQWAMLGMAASGGAVDLNFVIHGSDAMSMGGFAYGPALVTGQYWSDAYQFSLIPAPSALATLGLAGVLAMRRRRA